MQDLANRLISPLFGAKDIARIQCTRTQSSSGVKLNGHPLDLLLFAFCIRSPPCSSCLYFLFKEATKRPEIVSFLESHRFEFKYYLLYLHKFCAVVSLCLDRNTNIWQQYIKRCVVLLFTYLMKSRHGLRWRYTTYR